MALLVALAACGPADREAAGRAPAAGASRPGGDSVAAVDAAGRRVALAAPARRVVSLVPSATDIALALGARAQLAGRTRYDEGAEVAALPSVGGGLDPSVETLLALRPDLVVVWESSGGGPRAALDAAGLRTFSVRLEDTTDVFAAIDEIGRLLGRDAEARALADSVRAQLEAVRRSVRGLPPTTALYVAGISPPMTAGPGTFVGQLLRLAGGRSVFDDVDQLWPTVAIEEIVRRQPDVVILPVTPTPEVTPATLRELPGWRELRAVREGRVVTVPVALLGRPGPEMGKAARLLRDALHPAAR
ncbi:MAG TPA: helical backbone metal receptor [Gemmatimonadaceae bacterium]|nr:helical backbone metal receptor [Gemmatimonadaceae bacterium]